MKEEDKPSKSTGQEETWTTVTAEEFGMVDIDAPIRNSRNVDCRSLGDLFLRAAHEHSEQGKETASRVYGLLSDITRMHLKPRDRAEPYGPLFVLDGRRGLIPSDLEGEQYAVIGRLVPEIRNPGLRARLADIVWHNDRKCADMARQAIGAYVRAVQSVLDGNAEFFRGNTVAGSRDGCKMLCRASQIAHATGWKEPEGPLLQELLLAVIRDAVDRKCRTGFLHAGEIALDFGIGDPASLAVDAETFAESEVGDVLGS